MRNRITKYIFILLAVTILVSACNIDSRYGVLQHKFNASASDAIPVQSVLGKDSNDNIIFLSIGGDIYSSDGMTNKKIAEMTRYNTENSGISPIFAKDNVIYLTYQDKGEDGTQGTEDDRFVFFHATASDLNQRKVDADYVNSNTIPFTLPDGTELTFISAVNFNLDRTYVLYTTPEDNVDVQDPDDSIKHYGFIDRESASTSGITIEGGAEVHAASAIFGDRAVRVYTDDSDLDYSDMNHFYWMSEDGTTVEKEADFTKGDYDYLPVSSDGSYVITLDGDLYNLETDRHSGFVDDLIYRVNDIMPVFTNDNGDKIGYLYQGGIYVNQTGQESPYLIKCSDDNDLITSAWIGSKDNNYLMATQENGFWIVSLREDSNGRYTGSIHEYTHTDDPNAEFDDGPISDYLN